MPWALTSKPDTQRILQCSTHPTINSQEDLWMVIRAIKQSTRPAFYHLAMKQNNFLSGRGPEITVQRIDFTETTLPELNGLYAAVLDNVLSASECARFVEAAEATSNGIWEQAQVNVGMNQQVLMKHVRDCGRIIWDDEEIVARLWNRVKGYVPEIETLKNMPYVTGMGPTRRKEVWKAVGLNERMRFLKYGAGQYFRREYLKLGARPPHFALH